MEIENTEIEAVREMIALSQEENDEVQPVDETGLVDRLSMFVLRNDNLEFTVRDSRFSGCFDIVFKSRIIYEGIPNKVISDRMCDDYNKMAGFHLNGIKGSVESLRRTVSAELNRILEEYK